MADSPAVRIELLGVFRVTVGTHAVPAEAWRRSKAAGLLKLLALAPGHRIHRDQAMDRLWPELAPAAAAANLRKATELCVCDVAWIVERSQTLVSHHVRALRTQGIVRSKREGKMVMYSLTEEGRTLLASVLPMPGARRRKRVRV